MWSDAQPEPESTAGPDHRAAAPGWLSRTPLIGWLSAALVLATTALPACLPVDAAIESWNARTTQPEPAITTAQATTR